MAHGFVPSMAWVPSRVHVTISTCRELVVAACWANLGYVSDSMGSAADPRHEGHEVSGLPLPVASDPR